MICEVILSKAVAPKGDFRILTIISPRTSSPLSLCEEYWTRCPTVIQQIQNYPDARGGTTEGKFLIELSHEHLVEFKKAVDEDWTAGAPNPKIVSPLTSSPGTSPWTSTVGNLTNSTTMTMEKVIAKTIEIQDVSGLTLKEDWPPTMDWMTTGSLPQVPQGAGSAPAKWVSIYTKETSGLVTKRHVPVW